MSVLFSYFVKNGVLHVLFEFFLPKSKQWSSKVYFSTVVVGRQSPEPAWVQILALPLFCHVTGGPLQPLLCVKWGSINVCFLGNKSVQIKVLEQGLEYNKCSTNINKIIFFQF